MKTDGHKVSILVYLASHLTKLKDVLLAMEKKMLKTKSCESSIKFIRF